MTPKERADGVEFEFAELTYDVVTYVVNEELTRKNIENAIVAAVKAERERVINVARALSESLYHDGMIEDAAGVDVLVRKLLVEIERAVESETETTRREVPPVAGSETTEGPSSG